MTGKLFTWVPLVLTALLMYLAKRTNIGVTNYNVFLLLLLGWALILIVFFRTISRRRRGDDKIHD
ncbi:MAG: hypothetical protein PVG03_13440 [Desulfarculaceae bacterium]|jgi:cbb3-type cytochrome oxidase subunit 1